MALYVQVKPINRALYSSDQLPAISPSKFKHLKAKRFYVFAAFEYLKLYFATCCNHCYIYLVKSGLTWLERIFWFILIAIAHYICYSIALHSIDRYMSKNSYIGIERNYFEWNTSLPSLTICPMERLDKERFEEYCQHHRLNGKRQLELWDFLEHLANSTYTNFQDIPIYPSLDQTLDELKLTPDRYMEVIYNLTVDYTLNPIVKYRIRCIDNDEYIHSRQVLTEYGICYMTNNLIDERYTAKYLLYGVLPEPNIYEKMHRVKSLQKGSFPDKYVDYNFIGFPVPIDVYSHSHVDVMKVDHNYGYTNENLYYEPTVSEYITDTDLETVANVKQRNCRFTHESNLTHFPVYTKSICRQECRLKLVYEICKCIPHFYPNRLPKPKRICDYRTLRECLPEHESYFLKLYRRHPNGDNFDIVPCFCDEDCMGSVITQKVSVYARSRQLFGSYGAKVSMRTWPTVRFKRELYLTFHDLLVYIGGTAGLFLGFSVLGAIEIFYFFTMRLLFNLLGYKL